MIAFLSSTAETVVNLAPPRALPSTLLLPAGWLPPPHRSFPLSLQGSHFFAVPENAHNCRVHVWRYGYCVQWDSSENTAHEQMQLTATVC